MLLIKRARATMGEAYVQKSCSMAVNLAGRAQLVYNSAHLLHCPLQQQHLVAIPLLDTPVASGAACQG